MKSKLTTSMFALLFTASVAWGVHAVEACDCAAAASEGTADAACPHMQDGACPHMQGGECVNCGGCAGCAGAGGCAQAKAEVCPNCPGPDKCPNHENCKAACKCAQSDEGSGAEPEGGDAK